MAYRRDGGNQNRTKMKIKTDCFHTKSENSYFTWNLMSQDEFVNRKTHLHLNSTESRNKKLLLEIIIYLSKHLKNTPRTTSNHLVPSYIHKSCTYVNRSFKNLQVCGNAWIGHLWFLTALKATSSWEVSEDDQRKNSIEVL